MAEEKKDPGVHSFTDLIDELDMGQCSAECSRALREVIARNAEIAGENGNRMAVL